MIPARTVLLTRISPGLAIKGTPPTIGLGVLYSFTFSVSGGSGVYVWVRTGALPAGIIFTDNGNGTATLSGTTSASGTYPIRITVRDSNGYQGIADIALEAPPLTLQLRQTTVIKRGIAVSGLSLFAEGGSGSGYVFSIVSGLAGSGLSIAVGTNLFTGVPTTIATYAAVLKVVDSAANNTTITVPIVVQSRLSLLTPNPLTGKAETNCSTNYQLLIAGATGAVTFTPVAPTSDLQLSAAGLLTTSTVGFSHPPPNVMATLNTTATDAGTGDTLAIALQVVIAARPTATNAALGIVAAYPTFWPPQTIGVPYYIPPPVVSGGTPPYEFVDLVGNLSAFGLTIDSATGAISGSATSFNAACNGYQSGVIIGVGIKDALYPFGFGNGFISGNLAQFLPNNSQQPQKNSVNVGSRGPINFNFSFVALGTTDLDSTGTTVTVTIAERASSITSGTFVVAAVNSTQVVNVVTSNGYLVGDFCNISDGSHTITGLVTVVNSAIQLTVKTLVISAGAAGNTMALAAVLKPAAMPAATTAIDGYLTSIDWGTFNGKQAADADLTAIAALSGTGWLQRTGTNTWSLTSLTLSGSNTGDVTLAAFGAVPNANGASLVGQVLTIQPANTSFPGGLTAADWNAFNGKQAGDADLTAIAALSGTGFARRTGTNAWTLILGTSAQVVLGDGTFGTYVAPVVTTIATSATIVAQRWNIVNVNAAALTPLLPAAPTAGDLIQFACMSTCTSLSIDGNGNSVMGKTTMICDLKRANGVVVNFGLIFNAAEGWLVA